MVYILQPYAEKYPRFTEFVYAEIPQARQEPQIWDAMREAAFERIFDYADSEMNWQASQAMQANTFPMIVPHWYHSKDTTFYAEFDLQTSWILLNEYWVSQFECDYQRIEAKRFIKATILHELVHYIDWLDGSLQDYEIHPSGQKIPKPGVEERGHYFEKKAFNGIVGGWKHERCVPGT